MNNTGPQKFNFPKAERLKGKKNIEELFKNGSSLFFHPFLLKYLVTPKPVHGLLISVPKKKLKRAVDRNIVKRRIREIYRLNKHLLHQEPTKHYHVGLVYQETKILTYKEIEEKLIILLRRLRKKIEAENENH